MANEKISELPSGSPAQPGDEIPIARSGTNFQLLAQDIANLSPAFSAGQTNLGNSAGQTGTVSNELIFVGGANITLSQATNAFGNATISIIGGAGGGAAFSAGVSNIGNTLGNTGVTGTQLVLAGDNNITLSQFTSPSGATISISAFNQTVQTQNVVAVSIGGNTSGVAAAVSSGTLFLAGGNNVTLSQNGNSISISAGTAAAAVLSVSAGSTSGAFGGLTFSNGSGISWGLNNGTITASAVQSVQTQASGNIGATGFATTTVAGSVIAGTNNTAGFTLGVPPYITTQTNQTQNNVAAAVIAGNTAGVTASISSGTLALAGGNNVTLSQNANSVTISAAAQSAQTLGVYGISNTTGQSSFSSADARSLSFAGAGNVSVGLSNGSVVISGATAIPPSTGGILVAGNTTGQSFFSTYAQSSFNVSAAGLISAGWSSNSLIISAPATTGISQSMFAASNTTQGTSGTQSIGSLIFAGAGNVSVGVSNGSIIISGSGGGGGGGVNFGVSTGGNTAGATGTVSTGNVVLVGSGPISLSQATGAAGSAATITINAPATSSLSGTGNASISVAGSTISIGANAAALSIGGNSTSAGAGFSNISTGTAVLFGGPNVTLSQNGASISISAGAGGGGNFSAGVSGGNTSNTSGTVSNAFVLAGGNNITISAATGAGGMTATISGASQSVQTQASGNIAATGFATTTTNGSVIVGTNNTAGFTLAVPPYVTAAVGGGIGIQVSNTTYTSGTVTLQNANGITFGSSGAGGISASYTVPSTAGLISRLNVSAAGGTSNAVSGLTFTNSGGVSFGLSTGAGVGTITAAVATTAQYNFLGNTTGQSSTSTALDQSLSLSMLGGISGGWSGGTILLSGPPISSISGTGLLSVSVNGSTISLGVPGTTESQWMPYWGSQSAIQIGNGSIQVYPANMDRNFSASRADIYASITGATIALSTYAGTVSAFVGIYTRNGSTLSLASSGSQSYSFSNSSNNNITAFTGMRNLSVPINVNGSPQDAWIAVMSQTASANTNAWTASNMLIPGNGAPLAGILGASANATQQQALGLGVFSVSSAALPSSMAFSAINGTASNVQMMPAIAFHNVTA